MMKRSSWPLLFALAFMVSCIHPDTARALNARWSIFPGDGTPLGLGTACAVDTRRGRVVMFGMWRGPYCLQGANCFGTSDANITLFTFINSAFHITDAVVLAGSPSPRSGACAAYDSLADRVYLFGGRQVIPGPCTARNCPDPPRVSLSDLYYLDFSLQRTVWHPVAPTGPAPAPRYDAALMVDPIAHRLLLFGGHDSLGTAYADLWELPLDAAPAWHRLTVPGAGPSARWSATALFDAARSRLLLVGGADAQGTTADVWALSLSGALAWSAVPVAGTPPVQMTHAALDASRGIVVSYARPADLASFALTGDATWEAVPQTGPPTRSTAGGFGYDPVHDLYWVPFEYGNNISFGATVVDHAVFTLADPPSPPALTPVRDSMRFSRGLLREYWQLNPVRQTYSEVVAIDQVGFAWSAQPGIGPSGALFGRPILTPGIDFTTQVGWTEIGYRYRGPVVTGHAPDAPLTMAISVDSARFTAEGVVRIVWRCADDSLSLCRLPHAEKRFADTWEPTPTNWPDSAQRIVFTESLLTDATVVDYRVAWDDPAGSVANAGLVHLVREGSSPPPPPIDSTKALLLGRPGPNPAGASVTIDLTAERAGTAVVRLLDLRGRLVREWRFITPMQSRESLDLTGLGPGMYVIAFEQGRLRRTRRVMVFR